jgi:hypothetical protein
MNPRALAPLIALAWLALATVAQAQTAEDPAGPIEIKIRLPDDDGKFQESNAIEQIDFFNYAHCQCSYEAVETPPPADLAESGFFQIELTLVDSSYDFPDEDAQLRVGTNCGTEDVDSADRLCEDIATIEDVINDLRGADTYPVRARQLMFPAVTDGCKPEDGESNVYVNFNPNNDATVDEAVTATYKFDAKPPPLPENVEASAGEGAINIRWDALESRQAEVYAFQALCARADGSPVFDSPKDDALFDTPSQLCGGTNPADLFPGQGTTPGVDAGPGDDIDAGPSVDAGTGVDAGFAAAADLPAWMANLDPDYVCGSGSATGLSIRIDGLENGQTYRVALVSVDDARNVVGVDLGEVTPQSVTDFWEDYHNQGGGADGGICLVNSTFGSGSGMTQALRDFRDGTLATFAGGRMLIGAYYAYVAPLGVHAEESVAVRATAALILAPLAGVAAFWEYTSLPMKLLVLMALLLVRRLRRRRRLDPGMHGMERAPTLPRGGFGAAAAALATVLVVCAWAAPAAAQSDPYWDDFGPEVEEDTSEPAISYWNVGIKLGPYLPGIDSELDAEPGPYERVYGGAALMGIVDVERFFLFPLGQIGIAASLGFTGQTANSFATCGPSDTGCTPGETLVDENGEPVRAAGDKTSFRLVPTSIGAVYRFTYLDDQWHVPVVPYARLGLSYYVWWMTAPDGSLSEYQPPDCPDCDGDRALGASLGWQGSVGLAVRAERLDPQSARSLRNDLGINHAGFYAELMYADVSGFGAEGKLHVGALTWFAGLNFEF